MTEKSRIFLHLRSLSNLDAEHDTKSGMREAVDSDFVESYGDGGAQADALRDRIDAGWGSVE